MSIYFQVKKDDGEKFIKNSTIDTIKQNIAYAEEVCLVTPIDVESENCSNMTEHPVDICTSISVELSSTEYQMQVQKDNQEIDSEKNSDGKLKTCFCANRI